jgi:hypothetical protein
MMIRISLCLVAMTLCGCGPSAKQVARQSFRESVAAMKVCTQGATYAEFREKSLALEACYTANESVLVDKSKDINQLVQVMKATDILWDLNNQIQSQFPNFVPDESKKSEEATAMKIIKEGSGYTYAQIKSEGGFPNNYVQHGLALISSLCDNLLK